MISIDLDSFSSEVKNPLNLALVVVLLYLLTPVVQAILPADPNKPIPTSHLEAYSWMPAKHTEAILWKEYTPRSLRPFDGTNPDHSVPILFAIRGKVYDVSSGRSFYGPGGPYGACISLRFDLSYSLTLTVSLVLGNFAGRDASRGLAKQSFDEVS